VRTVLHVAGLVLALLVSGCRDNGTDPAVVVEKGNFTLYVSNQSLEKPTMAITVTLDGRQVVSTDFQVGDQHQFLRLALDLAAGPRRIVARAGDGTVVDDTFTMPEDGERWGVLTFWASAAYYAPHFQWEYLEEEPLLA
jgi:hypothetical protein